MSLSRLSPTDYHAQELAKHCLSVGKDKEEEIGNKINMTSLI